jgi:ribonuclease R
MPAPLPSRAAILDLLAKEGRAVHARDLKNALGVDDASFGGFVRLLDNLAFDGLLSAKDESFYRLTVRPGAPVRAEVKKAEPPRPEARGEAARQREKEKAERRAKRSSEHDAPTPGWTEAKEVHGAEKTKKPAARERDAHKPAEKTVEKPRETTAWPKPVRPAGEMKRGSTREGVLTMNARGFGFVSSVESPGDDLYISPEAIGGALHGDKVKVRLVNRGARGGEGEIVEIVARGKTRIAGILRRKGKSAWVEPDDTRSPPRIELESAIDKDAAGNSGNDGDVVIVVITRFPEQPRENPLGKLEAVLGRPGELQVEVRKTLAVAQIPELHPPAAVEEAEAFGQTVPESMLVGRVDLTHLPLPTIDPDDARDHDDAVWVVRTPKGGFRAWIAIADVSSYVIPGNAIDVDAESRGCSVYLPDRAIPMLPRALSSNLCSLLPDVIRLCLCAEVELDANGIILETQLHRAFMKSRAKLTYGGVARALKYTDQPPVQPQAEEMVEDLKVAAELSRLLRGLRMKRGALDFELPEPKVVLDDDGHPIDITRRSNDPGMKKAYSLIEELMLLGNEVVAQWMVQNDLPTIFRVHLQPDETKLQKLSVMCEELGVPFEMDDVRDPVRLAQLLKSFSKHPLANVLNMLLLRAMKQAAYDPVNRGHFGLASKAYLHFTSPIRRYPDLVVHRTVHQKLLGKPISRSDEAKEVIATAALTSSQNERRAMEVEREVVDLYRCVLMRDRIGERYEGTITAVVGSGVFVVLDDPFVDVMVKLEDLGGSGTQARWEVDDGGLRVTSSRSGQSLGLGDKLVVEIIDAAILRRTVYGRRVPGLEDTRADRGAGNSGADGDASTESRGGTSLADTRPRRPKFVEVDKPGRRTPKPDDRRKPRTGDAPKARSGKSSSSGGKFGAKITTSASKPSGGGAGGGAGRKSGGKKSGKAGGKSGGKKRR